MNTNQKSLLLLLLLSVFSVVNLFAATPTPTPSPSPTATPVISGNGTIGLAWDAPIGAIGYRLYEHTGNTYTLLPYTITNAATDAAPLIVTGIVPGNHVYAVSALYPSGLEVGYSNEVSVTVVGKPANLRVIISLTPTSKG